MSFKKSCSNVQKNKNIWASNLTRYQDSVKIRRNNPLEQFSLAEGRNSTPSRSYRSLQVSWNRNEKQKRTKLWNRERTESIVAEKTQFSSHIWHKHIKETVYAVEDVWKMPKEKGVWSPKWSFWHNIIKW